jgi:NADPH:quinone reductase-like Zn-dependent oxidoreductase
MSFDSSRWQHDLILGANAHRSIFDYQRALNPDGIYVMAGAGGIQMLQGMLLGPLLSLLGSRKMRLVMAKITGADLDALGKLLASGKIIPVIEQRYPLRDAAEAIRYVSAGHAKGKVVITVD